MAALLSTRSPAPPTFGFTPPPRDQWHSPAPGPLSWAEYQQIADAHQSFIRSRESTGISEAENAEIDAAAAAHELEVEQRAERIRHLSEFKDTLHPDRLMQVANTIAEGEFQGPPAPPPAPERETDIPAYIASIPTTTGERPGPGLDAVAGAVEPGPSTYKPEEQPVDLSNILGGISDIANAYVAVRGARQPPQTNFVQQPTNPYTGTWQDWLDGPTDWLAPATPAPVPTAGGSVGCISQRDREIGARAGVPPEVVDRVLASARKGRRRRKKLCTESDIRCIAAMKQVLGDGKNFQIWLAKNG